MTELKDKHIIITGAGSGSGAALALDLGAKGAKITLIGRSLSKLEKVAAELAETGFKNTLCLSADVSDFEGLKSSFTTAIDKHGPLDIVIANAGAAISSPFHRTGPELWQQMIDINLTGVFNTFNLAYLDMKKRGKGRLIAIASTAGLRGYSYVIPYSAAKHGVIGLVKSLALEVASSDITVNAICPGFMETPMLEESIQNIMEKTGRGREDAEASLYKNNPQQRFIQVDEICATVNWLCSDQARSVTGQAISLSGGEV
ncbi:MAG: SDR family NAD(P)-dependent oxidoreductase [Alphaproteobacteria bacterium]|nr:SDR family NAD(P)-dependent oxidoreductase [Alphaproteobacteria bacterium]